MDKATANLLCQLNSDFYRENAASFAATRQSPWPGWQRCLDIITAGCGTTGTHLALCDLACGNLRFETFLADALPHTDISCYAVDNCRELAMGQHSALTAERHTALDTSAGHINGASADSSAKTASPASKPIYGKATSPANLQIRFQELDIIGLLVDGQDLNRHLQAAPCDLCVSFGFMHHIPGARRREAFLQSLVQQTRPGGYAVVSLWQFLDDPGLKAKAEATHEQALLDPRLAALDLSQLEPGDCLIGWNKAPGQYRYCHHFSDAEIDQLATSIAGKATVAARFQSDGRGGTLNSYLVLRAS